MNNIQEHIAVVAFLLKKKKKSSKVTNVTSLGNRKHNRVIKK